MTKIGYARVSTPDQSLDLQHDALLKAGVEIIYSDIASGAKTDRPELAKCLAYLRAGDTLCVWRLDRLGRSLPHLITTVHQLLSDGIGFCSLTEAIDTTTSTGRLLMGILASLASFEKDLIRDRTMAGLEAARARGRKGGRPPKLTPAQVVKAAGLMEKGDIPIVDIMRMFDVSRATLYNSVAELKKRKAEGSGP